MQLTFVKTLNGTNFKDWVESLKLYLTVTNLDLVLREDEPIINADSTPVHRAHHKRWNHFNIVYLILMKYTMEKTIRQSVVDSENAKEFIDSIVEKYVKFDKVERGNYLSLLENTMHDGVSGVREHVMKLVHYHNKLRRMNADLGDSFLI